LFDPAEPAGIPGDTIHPPGPSNTLQYAINIPNYGTFADAALVAELAAEAEAAGWDGFFVWDHILAPYVVPIADPWVLLTAVAIATRRIRIGPMVTPLPRRRPEELARQAVTIDRLSDGRLILGLGSGDDTRREYSAFDGPADDRTRAELLDEGLEVLAGLWTGEPFTHEGQHFHVNDATFLPRPVQQPRIPIWIAGRWPYPRPFRRAAHWDGAIPVSRDGPLRPEQCRAVADLIERLREDDRIPASDQPFDIAVVGWNRGKQPAEEVVLAQQFAAAGATWFQVALSERYTAAEALDRIRTGPPR